MKKLLSYTAIGCCIGATLGVVLTPFAMLGGAVATLPWFIVLGFIWGMLGASIGAFIAILVVDAFGLT